MRFLLHLLLSPLRPDFGSSLGSEEESSNSSTKHDHGRPISQPVQMVQLKEQEQAGRNEGTALGGNLSPLGNKYPIEPLSRYGLADPRNSGDLPCQAPGLSSAGS